MPYLDTSVVVAALTNEARTASVQTWLAAQPPEQAIISDWVVSEFSAALSMKLRTGQLDAEMRADALAEFTALVNDTFTLWPVTRADFQVAARLADRHDTGVRAADALHLAVVSNRGGQLVSLDRRQVDAGLALGVSAHLL